MAGEGGEDRALIYEVEGFITIGQLRRFLLNALRVGNPGDDRLWPEVEGRVTVHARFKREASAHVEGAVRGVKLVEARGVDAVEYRSASGRSQLKWTRLVQGLGRVEGRASPWTLRNLYLAGVDLSLLRIRLAQRP